MKQLSDSELSKLDGLLSSGQITVEDYKARFSDFNRGSSETATAIPQKKTRLASKRINILYVLAGCLLAVMIILFLGIIKRTPETHVTSTEQQTKKQEIETANAYKDSTNSHIEENKPDSFAAKLERSCWLKDIEGFMYPDFMMPGTVETSIGPVNLYTYEDIVLASMFLGVWATIDDQFPKCGEPLTDTAFIDTITYTSNKVPVYSGYVNDGRIFYMRTNVDKGEVNHLRVLTLIYPEEYKTVVKPMVDIVMKWQ